MLFSNIVYVYKIIVPRAKKFNVARTKARSQSICIGRNKKMIPPGKIIIKVYQYCI